ncbi:MAG: hypothetical protein JWM03_1861 [Rhodocyclales bacterium]|nr:hypothetical protein [Rhodocyclales bacterium]MDB5888989.1 hypothetical protein [Rhodocyclales bacterium]
MRNLLLFLFILIGVYYLRRLMANDEAGDSAKTAAEPPREAERVLPCDHCGLLVPASEGLQAQGHFFCSVEHSRLGPATQ